jgi:hypothetical protein
MQALLFGSLVSVLLGCASAPRPVPADSQMVAQAEVAGVTLQVPRMDHKGYPDHVFAVATPVYVFIDNRSGAFIQIGREGFTLGPPGGLQGAPLSPRKILVRTEDASAPGLPAAPALAARGSPRPDSAPAAVRVTLIHAPIVAASSLPTAPAAPRTPPPPPPSQIEMDPAAGTGADGYSGGWAGPVGPWRGRGWGLYGPAPFWSYYGGPVYIPQPSRSIIQMALQSGQLPPGSSASGFLSRTRSRPGRKIRTLQPGESHVRT